MSSRIFKRYLVDPIGGMHKYPMILITILYVISYGVTLLNGGLFHDDPICYQVSAETLARWANMARAGWTLYTWLLSIIYSGPGGIFLGRVIIFLAYIIAGLIAYRIVYRIDELTDIDRTLLVGIFVLFPVNHARIELLSVIYALSYVCFYAGWLLLCEYVGKRRLIVKYVALALFFISFFTESLLVLYLMPVLHVMYLVRPWPASIASWLRTVRHWADMLVLPMVFWLVRWLYFAPSGRYDGYNDPSLWSLLLSPIRSLMGLEESLWQPLRDGLIVALEDPWRVAVLVALGVFLYRNRSSRLDAVACARWLVIGLMAFMLALMPYYAVNRSVFTGFGTRFQLLVPLGASIIIYFGTRLLLTKSGSSDSFAKYVIILLLGAFSVANLESMLTFQEKYIKREALGYALAENETVRQSKTLALVDNGYYYNTRPYKPWDASALLRQFRGGTNSLAMFVNRDDSIKKIQDMAWSFYNRSTDYKKRFGYGEWDPGKDIKITKIEIGIGEASVNQRTALISTMECLRNRDDCRRSLARLIKITLQ